MDNTTLKAMKKIASVVDVARVGREDMTLFNNFIQGMDNENNPQEQDGTYNHCYEEISDDIEDIYLQFHILYEEIDKARQLMSGVWDKITEIKDERNE